MNDLLEQLGELTLRTHILVHERKLGIIPSEGFQFSVTSIGASARDFFHLGVEVETEDGLKLLIGRRYHLGGAGSERFDIDGVMKGLATTLSALSSERSNSERREGVLDAVEARFEEARSLGVSCRMTALLQRPLRIGDTDGRVAFELLSTMLRSDLTRGAFSMALRDAAEFTRIFEDEVMPEQLERAGRLRDQMP